MNVNHYDYTFSFIPTWLGYVLRFSCIIVATMLGGLCISYRRHVQDKFQRARFLGLALFCLGFDYGTIRRLGEPVAPTIPIFIAAISFSFYGMFGLRHLLNDDKD